MPLVLRKGLSDGAWGSRCGREAAVIGVRALSEPSDRVAPSTG